MLMLFCAYLFMQYVETNYFMLIFFSFFCFCGFTLYSGASFCWPHCTIFRRDTWPRFILTSAFFLLTFCLSHYKTPLLFTDECNFPASIRHAVKLDVTVATAQSIYYLTK